MFYQMQSNGGRVGRGMMCNKQIIENIELKITIGLPQKSNETSKIFFG